MEQPKMEQPKMEQTENEELKMSTVPEVEKVTKVTTVKKKNPNRVAAGKKVAEFNRKKKENLKQSNDQEPEKVDETKEPTPVQSTSMSYSTYLYTGVGLLILGGAAALVFLQKKPSEPVVVIPPSKGTNKKKDPFEME